MFSCYPNKSVAGVLTPPFRHSWIWLLPLLSIALICVTADLQLVPHFSYVPPSVTPINGIPSNSSVGHPSSLPPLVDLVCRAWPPNARISLAVSPRSSSSTESATFKLTPLTEGEADGVLASLLVQLQYAIQSTGRAQDTVGQTDQYFETLKEAVRRRPGSLPTDEVAVRLTIPDSSLASSDLVKTSLDRLEQMQLFCLVETPFGGLVSRPFHVRSTSLGEFPASQRVAQNSPSLGLGPDQPPAGSQGEMPATLSTTLNIRLNNVAVIDCLLPVNAFPEPVVHVELNGSLIDVHNARNSQKYRLVRRPDNRRVSLLIRQVQIQDSGLYRCFFINPLTGQLKASPEPVVNLQIITPTKPVPATVFTPLASAATAAGDGRASSSDGVEQAKAQVITVNEGENVTLFCVIHAAPPPIVKTYPFQLNSSRHQRFHRDDLFGLLHITNVQPNDAGFYICSEGQISSTAQLLVRSRLKLVALPRDTRIARLGGSVEFTCSTSDPAVVPDWLVNGKPVGGNSLHRSPGSSKLTVPSVGHGDLGFYQCIAWRPSHKGERHEGEWVNATALLTLATDELLATPDSLTPYLPKTEAPESLLIPPDPPGEAREAPSAETIFDNLAVLLTWQSVEHPAAAAAEVGSASAGNQKPVGQEGKGEVEKSSGSGKPSVEYRLEFSVQQTAVEVASALARENSSSPADAVDKPSSSSPSSAGGKASGYSAVELAQVLAGFVGFEAIRWSEPKPLGGPVSTPYTFVSSPPLEPGKRYRFRVIPPDPVTGMSGGDHQHQVHQHLLPSHWSKTVSMEHISGAGPPEIQLVRHLSDGQIQVIWKFGDQAPPPVAPPAPEPSSSSAVNLGDQRKQGSPAPKVMGQGGVFSGEPGDFQADHFNVLARPVFKPKRNSQEPVAYGVYVATQVNGSQTREGFLTGLNRSLDYQVIVYAVRGAGDSRQITRFSKPVFVNAVLAPYGGRYSILASLANNRVLYMVLGGIAALMMFVVFILILLCMCRQLRDGPRRMSSSAGGMVAGDRKKHNGYTRGNSASGSGHKNPLDGGVGVQQLSATDGSNPTGACSLPTATQQSDYYPHLRQSLLVNPYTPLPDGKEPLLSGSSQHQQQQLMGSQFHLPYYPTPGGLQAGQQSVGPPHHHQSHHSLLLSPTPGSNPPVGRIFQTGTLPNPGSQQQQQHQHQQQQRYYRSGGQHPLVYNSSSSRAMTPGPMLEMTEYGGGAYQAHHQQQQQQVYAPHQQLPPLPPMAHQVGVYYPTGYPPGPSHQGLMTPGAMSLKRDQMGTMGGGGGGSLRDHGSAYGTLLQRGGVVGASHLTGSFISDQQQQQAPNAPHQQQQLSGTLQPGVSMATYYGGQTLQHHPPYVQAFHQFPGGYYGQQTPSDIMFVGGTPGSHQLNNPLQQQQQASFRATDGESVYSYFSQHEASGVPTAIGGAGVHQYLNALPEESNPMLGPAGYVESGMQTGGELNSQHHHQEQPDSPAGGGGSTTHGAAASGSGGHRHHRRRKRKQQQQSQAHRHTSESNGGGGDQDSGQLMQQQHPQQQQQQQQSDDQLSQTPGGLGGTDSQADENQITQSELSEEVQRKLSLTGGGTYSDADPLSGQMSFVYPQPSGYHVQHHNNNNNSSGLSNARYGPSDSSTPLRATANGAALPPPNQPPPPPPPNAAIGYGVGDLTNGAGFYSGHPAGSGQMYSPATATVNPGFMDYRRGFSASAAAGGLLVGPPPRVRDYSEYGIPRGIGLPPTPDGASNPSAASPPPHASLQHQLHHQQQMQQQLNQQYLKGQAGQCGSSPLAVNGVVYATGLEGHQLTSTAAGATVGGLCYREGQA